jgi:hypothetical protein
MADYLRAPTHQPVVKWQTSNWRGPINQLRQHGAIKEVLKPIDLIRLEKAEQGAQAALSGANRMVKADTF